MYISVDTEKDMIEVLNQMSEHYQVFFTYDTELLKNVKVNFDFKREESFDTAINRLMKETGFEYNVYNDKYLVIYKNDSKGKKAAKKLGKMLKEMQKLETDGLLSVKYNSKMPETKWANITQSINSMAEITVKGFVKSTTNEPMVGVYIQVKDGSLVTSTDINGEFSINLPTGNETLVFSYLGYKTVEIPVEQKTFIPVIMEETDVRLAEVSIVSTGFQTISKERITGSSTSVKSETLEDRPTTDLRTALNGQMSGVVADPTYGFIIRGRSTLSGDRLPLLVVDGFPIEGGFETLNPNDVKSVDVLKDAAATSIYGARAANGVIVVTTKRAVEKDKLRVNYNTFLSFGDNIDLRHYMNIIDAKTQIEFSDYFYNTFKSTSSITNPFNSVTYLGGTSDYFTMLFQKEKGLISEQDFNAQRAKMLTADYKDDFEKYFLQKPFTQQHNIIVSGASDKNSYKLSVLYDGNKTFIQNNANNKILVNFGNSFKISPVFTYNINTNLTYIGSKNNGVNLGYAKGIYSPFTRLFDDNGNYAYQSDRYFLPRAIADESRLPYSTRYNVLEESRLRDNQASSFDVRIQNDLEINLGKGLKIKPMFQFEQFRNDSRNIYDQNSFAVRDLQNYTAVYDSITKKFIPQHPPGGVYRYNGGNVRNSYKGRIQADYNTTINDRHELTLLLGGELIKGRNQFNSADLKYGYSSKNLNYAYYNYTYSPTTIFNSILINSPLGYEGGGSVVWGLDRQSNVQNERYIAAFFNGSYTLDKKYTLTASLRTDASNFISRTNRERFSPFFSAGLRWNVLQEGFLKNNKTFDRLAARITYGATGNAAGKYSLLPFSVFTTSSPVGETGNLSGGDIDGRLNDELTWEKTFSTNVGVDFSIFNTKLFGSIDVYNRLSKDLIASVQTSNVLWSVSSQVINSAEVVNKGLELTLGTNVDIIGDLNWSTNINADFNYNKILKYNFRNSSLLSYYGSGGFVEGLPTDRILGMKLAGVTKEGYFIQETKTGELVTLNNTSNYFAGVTTLGSPVAGVEIIDDPRLYYGGRSTPPVTLGFNNKFQWKGFTLMSVMTGRFGHKVKNISSNPNFFSPSTTKNFPQSSWNEIITTSPLVASNKVGVIYPNLDNRLVVATENSAYIFYSINNLDKASALRWDELYLSYDFGKNELGKMRNVFNSLNLFTQIRNLGLIWTNNSKGYDPVYLPGSIKPIRTLTVGARVGF
jgi:TonB-linked SusC/RagA family outer membrane protein